MDVMLMSTLIPIGFFVMVAFIVWAAARSKQRIAQSHADVQMKMIERFGSAHELSEFLNSPTGRSFVSTNVEVPNFRTRARILNSLRSSLILLFMGLAFILVPMAMHEESSGLFLAGAILLAIGLGIFVSTLLSLRLGRAWGLIGDDEKSATPTGPSGNGH